jgi:4-amino-4-deoxy-L-arabinose transferase-like glycosyltransferase
MEDVNAGDSLKSPGEAGIATSEPPLYYALQTVPYALGRGNMLVQLQLMRLFGVLLGAITALLTFFFLREILPAVPWAATVGALCVALQPLFGFMSGTVNPDTMLFTIAAGLFLCLARAFRRGFTWRVALALGLLIAVGFATKLNFVGLSFGVFAGLVVLTVREARFRGWRALRPLAIAGGIGLAPVALYALRNVAANHPTFGLASGVAGTITATPLTNEFSYVWELYLPRLPGMTNYFSGITPYRDIWFDRSVGLYGWMDTMFPGWVDSIALVPAAAVTLLCGRELLARRDALRARLPEFAVYAAMTLGVLVMLGVSSYSSDVIAHELAFGEPRYLLPMLPLLGAVIALAVRGGGRRWAPVVGAAMVVLFLGHDIFSQLQAIARYYG